MIFTPVFYYKQLMDMGFSREHCTDALTNTMTLEQATDYILTHPPATAQVSALTNTTRR